MTGLSRSDSDLSRKSFARILLVKPSSLGDVVHALPVLHGLRQRYPQAKIDWLVATSFAPFLEGHQHLDELVLFDRRRFSRAGRSLRITAELLRFGRNLRARHYDLVIDLQGLFRSGMMTWASGAPVRLGFRSAREAARLFYTHYIDGVEPNSHAVERNYRVARLLGFADLPIRFVLPPPQPALNDAEKLLNAVGVGKAHPVVAVAPGARWETKVWPPERFATTIDRLWEGSGARTLLVGGSEEVSLCGRIARACRNSPVDLSGRTTLPQLVGILRLVDLVICHDSAVAHLATALAKPLVCLIGPTNPDRTGPYGRSEDVVRVDLDCAPCYFRRLSQCPHNHRCMDKLDVDTVVAAAEKSLARVVSENT